MRWNMQLRPGCRRGGGTRRSRGFSLLEALVALVILSVGLLGIAGLQARGLLNNVNANYRTQAVFLADDMVDRMRANKRAFEGGVTHYDKPAEVETPGCRAASGCTAKQMAENDFSVWSDQLSSLLPLGDGVVCIDSTPVDGMPAQPACDGNGDLYAIKIWWDEDRDGQLEDDSNATDQNQDAERYVLAFRPLGS